MFRLGRLSSREARGPGTYNVHFDIIFISTVYNVLTPRPGAIQFNKKIIILYIYNYIYGNFFFLQAHSSFCHVLTSTPL